jgi:hypothetical protein
VTANTWNHIVIQRRSDNTWDIYVNGNRVFSTNTWGSPSGYEYYDLTSTGSINVNIGGGLAVLGGSTGAQYISNFRFVRAQVYSGSTITVPTSPLTAISNTRLLTFQTSNITDNSSYNYSLKTGNTPNYVIGPAYGGGAGGYYGNPNYNGNGYNGGSGGGGAGGNAGGYTGGYASSGQGNNGGTSLSSNYYAAGGGGAGAAGHNNFTQNAGFLSDGPHAGGGGDGLQYDISGTATYYAGGGGGGSVNNGYYGGSAGGAGGGGSGGGRGYGNYSGIANTGGGGGGGYNGYAGGAGGSGIVILRYTT